MLVGLYYSLIQRSTSTNRSQELKTVQKTCGPKAKGQKQNPNKSVKGRHYQAVSDAAVSRDLDKILLKLENDSDPELSTGTPSPIADHNKVSQFKNIETPQKSILYYFFQYQ